MIEGVVRRQEVVVPDARTDADVTERAYNVAGAQVHFGGEPSGGVNCVRERDPELTAQFAEPGASGD